ncbi:MAG: hypothetical protein SLRJCFUN_002606 [Candidatus Fervidibacter sp.]
MEATGEKELLVWLNGELVPKSQAKISVYDHGLPYDKGATASSHLAHAAGEWVEGCLHPCRRHQRCRRLGLRPAQVPSAQCHHHHRPH